VLSEKERYFNNALDSDLGICKDVRRAIPLVGWNQVE
jgi:hypothetical protein